MENFNDHECGHHARPGLRSGITPVRIDFVGLGCSMSRIAPGLLSFASRAMYENHSCLPLVTERSRANSWQLRLPLDMSRAGEFNGHEGSEWLSGRR